MNARSICLAVMLLTACTTETVIQQPEQPKSENTPTEAVASTVVTALTVDRISLYQGVEVRLVTDGELVAKRNAPILTKRPALVRVHAKKAAGSRPPKVTAKLHVKSGGAETVKKVGPRAVTTFVDNNLDSTFNFELDADLITKDLELSVELIGADAADTITFPADGATVAAEAVDASKLRVQLVPVKYQADGEDRLPDLSDENMKRYHDALYKMYPVSEVDLTLHKELIWPVPVAPEGDGWGELLGAIKEMRTTETVDDDVYYIGVFNPAPTLREFCSRGSGGCVLGIAPASGYNTELDTDLSLRTALVLGYQTMKSDGTVAQELAHAMGRLHADCGRPTAIDKKYPYEDARVGSSGWDVLTKELMDGEEHADFMSYCSPVWVSDYTWKAIFDRMAKVTTLIAAKGSDTKSSSLPAAPSKQSPKWVSADQIAWTIERP